MFSSSFGTWLSRPFVKFEGHGEQQEEGAVEQRGEATEGQPDARGQSDSTAQGDARGQRGGHEQQPFSLMRLLNLIATYFSILFVIGKATNLVDAFARKKRAVPA